MIGNVDPYRTSFLALQGTSPFTVNVYIKVSDQPEDARILLRDFATLQQQVRERKRSKQRYEGKDDNSKPLKRRRVGSPG